MRAVEIYKPHKVTVLGSGWLLELPIAEIIEKTGNVSLIDIIHPPEVVLQAGSIRNVELIEQDLTGGLIEEVWKLVSGHSIFSKAHTIEDLIIPEFKPEGDPGMIISLNILTQLETMLVRYLKQKSRIGDEEIFKFRKTIQNRHIDFITKYRSVLITDCEEVITNKSGEVKMVPTLIAEIPAFTDREEWTWNFDSKGADNYNSRSVMRVIAVTF